MKSSCSKAGSSRYLTRFIGVGTETAECSLTSTGEGSEVTGYEVGSRSMGQRSRDTGGVKVMGHLLFCSRYIF